MKQVIGFSLIILLFSGCNKIDDLLTFTISDESTIRIENNSPLTLPDIVTPDITTNSSTEFQNNNTRADLVKDVRLEEVKLTITSPSNRTFSFLKTIRIFISTNSSDEMEIASAVDIASSANTIDLTTTDERLDVYVKADSYSLRTEVITREILTQDVDIRVNLKFKVSANAL
jgi:hypothetical protein